MLTYNLHCEVGPATRKLKAEPIEVMNKQFTRLGCISLKNVFCDS